MQKSAGGAQNTAKPDGHLAEQRSRQKYFTTFAGEEAVLPSDEVNLHA
jgi:hypothetical protein